MINEITVVIKSDAYIKRTSGRSRAVAAMN
jgi:hypothetical protein